MADEAKQAIERGRQERSKAKIVQIELVLGMINNGIERHNRSKDPVMRSTLLVDKLCTIIDVGLVALAMEYDDLPDELREKMKASADSLKNELNFLLDWIASPQYSPDHVYGNALMKGAQNNFTSNNATK